MALRRGIATKHEIPGEPGQWMELRQLGWAELDEARKARQTESFDNIRAMGKDIFKTMQEVRREVGSADDGPTDPLQTYDLGTLLKAGISAWSYEDEVSPMTIRLLDPDTAAWAAKIIVGHKAESEAERKNGSEPSTSV